MSVRQFDTVFDVHGGLRGDITSGPDSQARIGTWPVPCRQKTRFGVGALVGVRKLRSYVEGQDRMGRGTSERDK